eukprot:Skav201939  [mRNA]  locus=scaffold2764:36293:45148:- [translate_table: standard]
MASPLSAPPGFEAVKNILLPSSGWQGETATWGGISSFLGGVDARNEICDTTTFADEGDLVNDDGSGPPGEGAEAGATGEHSKNHHVPAQADAGQLQVVARAGHSEELSDQRDIWGDLLPVTSLQAAPTAIAMAAEVYHLLEYTGGKAKVAQAIAKVVRKAGHGGDEFSFLQPVVDFRGGGMLAPTAMEACREALVGGLEKILEKHHKRLVLELQQWLDEHQVAVYQSQASDEKTLEGAAAATGVTDTCTGATGSMGFSNFSKNRPSGHRDLGDQRGDLGPSISFRAQDLVPQLSSSVSIMSPSRVTHLDKSDYQLAQKVSVMHQERQSRLSLETTPTVGPRRSQSIRQTPEACRPCCSLLRRIISSGAFEAFFAVVIATNSLFIGITIEWEARERTYTLPSSLFVIQIIYTFLFLSEALDRPRNDPGAQDLTPRIVCIKLAVFGPQHFFCSISWAWYLG